MTTPDTLHVLNPDPFNAETKGPVLIADFITAQRDFYVRSHGAIPALGDGHVVTIAGRGFTVAELKAGFEPRTVTATMQCAGNRRADLQSVAATSGDPWGVGAIGNARWTGVALIDVLAATGADLAEGRHVRFTGADMGDVDGRVERYGVSIPIEKARDRDVLLAWAMNDAPLTAAHGAPLRLMTPGFAGVRSPKWLTDVALADRPSEAPIQARDYKLFPAWTAKADADWDAGLTIDAMPINAAICDPADGARVPAGRRTLGGYAIAYGRRIARVDVSVDGGATWRAATLDPGTGGTWSWTFWSCVVDLAAGSHELVVRAVDAAGQMQPEHARDVWNFGGYFATMWHRVRIDAA